MFDFRDYLHFSERYISMAIENPFKENNLEYFLIPSILLSWIAIESFINSIIDDFNSLPEDLFYLHERAFLLEKKLKFSDSGPSIGDFILDQTEYRRLEDKILFLIAKFKKTKSNLKGDTLWQKFMELKEIRNNIMHPRKGIKIDINIDNSKRYQDISKDVISFVSKHVYGKKIEF